MKRLFTTANQKLDHFLHDPNLDHQEFLNKKLSFYWTVYSWIGVIILTILAIVLDVYPIMMYGFTLIIMQIVTFILFGQKINFKISFAIQLSLFVLVTTIYAGIMGGLLNSGGIMLAGMYCVFMSAPLRSMKITVAIGLLYVLQILTLIMIEPQLTIHPDMIGRNNKLFFTINLTWLSVSPIFFLSYFFRQQEQYEEKEKLRLKELDATKSRLFTNITHEFRTPLTLILGMSREVRPVDKKSKDGLLIIRKNGNRLLRLVNQMMNLAKLDSGTMDLNLVQTDVVRFIQFIMDTFVPLAKLQEIKLKFTSTRERCMMDIDPEKLEEVLANLLSNALRYTEKGGLVEVYLNTFEVDHSNQRVSINVCDNGSGIPTEKLDFNF